MGSIPGQGNKISHAVEQLSPCTTIEAHTPQLESMCHNGRSFMTQLRPDIAKERKNQMEVLEMKNITVSFMAQQMTQLRKESANSKTGQWKLPKLKHKERTEITGLWENMSNILGEEREQGRRNI